MGMSLLFSYTFPTTWACSGLSPARARPWRANETCAARRTSKKDVRLERLLLFYAVCSLLSCRVWESLTCRNKRCSRLLIVFSAGNLLVNQRGRVWGGESRKMLISHCSSTDRLLPWCQNAYRSLLFSRFRYNSSALIMVSSIFCGEVPDGKYFFSRFFGIFHCST